MNLGADNVLISQLSQKNQYILFSRQPKVTVHIDAITAALVAGTAAQGFQQTSQKVVNSLIKQGASQDRASQVVANRWEKLKGYLSEA